MSAKLEPMIPIKQLLLVFALLLIATGTLYAQQTAARPDRGVNPGGSYAVSDIESINMQSGNVQLRIPLASLPPIAGGKLKLTLSAIYNSKLWNVTRSEQTGSVLPYRRTYRVDTPQLTDTGTVGGWSFEGGYAIFPRDARDDFNYEIPPGADPNDPYAMIEFQQLTQHNWWKMVLRTPDGAEHELRPSGGTYPTFNDPLQRRPYLWGYYRDTPETIGSPIRYNSTDGTYLSAIVNPPNHTSGVRWTIFLPDGTQIIQYTNGIQRIRDNNGNSIKIFGDANGDHYQDEQSGREIRVTYNPNGGAGFGQTQIWYPTVGGEQHIDINYGETIVQGKVYDVQDWNDDIYDENGNPGAPCRRQQLLTPQPLALPVVREIILPVTEPGVPGRRFTFNYNSDETETAVTSEMRWTCTVQPVSYTRTASKGLGALSQMVLPSGAKVNYTYSQTGVHDFVSMVGPGNILLETDTIARDGVLTKVLDYDDGPDDVWTYSIPNEPNSMTSSVQNPDNSIDTQHYYPTDPNFNAVVGQTLNGLVYSTSNGVITTLRHWTAGAQQATGAIASTTFNPLVDAEYTLIVGTTLMSAKTFQHDSNGNVTQVAEYDWFDSSQVTFQGGIPTGPPNGMSPLRVTTTSYYNSPPNTNSANYYILRSLTSGTPSILNAVRETTIGPAIARFSYDGNSFDVAPTIGNLTSKSVYNNLDENWITTSTTYDSYGNPTTTTDGRGKVTTFGYDNPALGLPNYVTVDPQNGTGTQTTTTTYDPSTGLVLSTIDPNGNISDINYTNQLTGQSDPFGRPGVTLAPVVNVNGSNQRQRATNTYHDSTRQVITASDLYAENDKLLKTRTTVDKRGRVVLVEQTEDGTNYTISSRKAYDTLNRMTFSSSPMRSGAAATDSWTRVTSDLLGRPIEVATFAGATQPSTAPVDQIAGWTGKVVTAYAANFTTVTDQAGKQRRSMSDGLGRLIRVDEPDKDSGQLGSTAEPIQPTCYRYDGLGNLTKVIQGSQIDPATGICSLSGSQQRTFTYDSLSRLHSALNPESGSISYQYDANGNLLVKTDARGVSAHYDYDALNRVKRRWYNGSSLLTELTHNVPALPSGVGASEEVNYVYDAGCPTCNTKGRLISVSSSVSTYGYSGYDALGRPGNATQTMGGQGYTTSYTYDLAGHIKTLQYPSGHVVNYTFDDAGRLGSFTGNLGDGGAPRTYANEFEYTALNGLQQEKFGTQTSIYHKQRYNSRGQLWDMRASTVPFATDPANGDRGAIVNYYSNNFVQGGSGSDNNGNLLRQENYIPGSSFFQDNFEYDQLNRLKFISEKLNGTGNPSFKQTYSYDRYGNRRINTSPSETFGGVNNLDFDLEESTNRLYALGDLGLAEPSRSMRYDAAGNLWKDTYSGAADGKQAMERLYDAENRMTKETQAGNYVAAEYSYDGDGRRVKRKIGTTETWQVYGIGGELLAEYAANTAASNPQKEYGYRNGELLITATVTAGWGAPPSYTGPNPLSTGDQIKLENLTELRSAVNQLRQHAGLAPYTFTVDPNPQQNVTTVKADHIRQLRTALEEARTALGLSTGGYAHPTLTENFSLIYAVDFQELRGQILSAWQSGGGVDIRWLVADQLGTPRVILDQSGSLANVSRHDYLPFGEDVPENFRTGIPGYGTGDNVRQKFTLKERDNETGLDYFLARYYSSPQGRFTSPDPLSHPAAGHELIPQSWNLYTYVLNNPLKLVDPDGLMWVYHYLDKEKTKIGIAWIEGNKIPKDLQKQGYKALDFGGAKSKDIALTDGSVVRLSANSGNPLQLRGPQEGGGDRAYVNAGLINEFGRRAPAMEKAMGLFAVTSVAGGYTVAVAGPLLLPNAAAYALYAAKEMGSDQDPAVMGTVYDQTKGNPGSIRNVFTDVSKSDFIKNMEASGYNVTKSGNATILDNGVNRYTVYDVARSTGGPTAVRSVGGNQTLKIRLKP